MAEDYNAKEEIITIDENESSYMELEYFKFFGKTEWTLKKYIPKEDE